MPKFSRRDFLRMAALGMGSVALSRFLAACAPQTTPSPAPANPLPSATSAPTTTQSPDCLRQRQLPTPPWKPEPFS